MVCWAWSTGILFSPDFEHLSYLADADAFWDISTLSLIDVYWCFLILIDSDSRWLILIDADWFWFMLICADLRWLILVDVDADAVDADTDDTDDAMTTHLRYLF